MLDRFDLQLLDAVQRDDGRTADAIAAEVPLSPSALARRLRRLRADGWITRTIALVSPKLTAQRVRALVHVQLDHHSPRHGLERLRQALADDPAVQWCGEISGSFDIALLTDHRGMGDFSDWADERLAADPAIRRYETSFVKKTIRFAPFARFSDQ